MILSDVSPWRQWLVRCFVFLGPLGSLLTPHFFPKPFRFYYFLLPLFPVFFVKIRREYLQIGLFFLPFFLYCFVSVIFLEMLGLKIEEDQSFKFCLLFCHFYFALGAASQISSIDELKYVLSLYLRSFFIALLIGYGFFIGYEFHIFPLSLIERFSVLAQFAYGVLRFSPGSYPNEFGIVSSFVLSLLILLVLSKEPLKTWGLSPLKISLLIPLVFGALFLTTTRAAYISFGICFFYFFTRFSAKTKYLFAGGFLSFFLLLQWFEIPFFSFVMSSFLQRIDEGSWGERYFAWLEGFHLFQDHRFFGVGFSSFSQLHNVYLSFLFELGVLGSLILVCCLMSYFLFSSSIYKDPLVEKIKKIGLFHVLWFAASNHNLHHHLTWFVFFLCFSAVQWKNVSCPIYQSECKRL
jgi:hypothetical protein